MEQLLLVAKILGAAKLQTLCNQLDVFLTEKEQDKVLPLLDEIELQITEIFNYAEAI